MEQIGDYFKERLVAFEYTSQVKPEQLVHDAQLQSREQLNELISAGIQSLWDDLPFEIRQEYKKAEVIHFDGGIDPFLIIERGKRALAKKPKEGSIRTKATEKAIKVKARNDYNDWKVHDSGEYPYKASFAEVLREKDLFQLIKESKKKTGKAFALDFMGYGQILRELPIDGGVAVALGDPRNEYMRELDLERNIHFVEGNVFHRKTWNEMQRWLDKQETDDGKFDLILSRPVRELDDLTNNKGINVVLLQRGWQMLSSNGGVLLTQFLEQVFEPSLVEQWIRLLNQTPGIKAEYSFIRNPACPPIAFRPVISLIKSEGAPTKLPLL